ncbi:MAG: S9 family peptidase [Phycisphaeraceae bacterium]|nr:S9 family peptidase [Phycisphaeraceae bacterium]
MLNLHRSSFLLLVTLMTMLTSHAVGSGDPTPITTNDLLRLRTIRDVEVDRLGRFAIVSVESFERTGDTDGPIRPGDCAIRRHLFRIDLEDVDATPRQLTFGDRRDSSPELSPTGDRLAFVRAGESGSDDDQDAGAQIWILPLDGGEARQVTRFDDGAGRPRWSPDGASLVVESRRPLAEIIREDGAPGWAPTRPGRVRHDEDDRVQSEANGVRPDPGGTLAEVRAWLEGNTGERNPRLVDRIAFQGEKAIEERVRLRQIYLVPLGDDAGPPRRLGRGVVDRFDPTFSVDGRSVFLAARSGKVHPDEILDARLERVDLAEEASSTVILETVGWAFTDPIPGPDGSLIAFKGRPTDEPFYRGSRIGLIPVAGGEPIWATDGAELDVGDFEWSNEAAKILFTAANAGAVPLYAASPATIEPVEIVRIRDGLPTQVECFAVGGDVIAWAESSSANPSVLRVRNDGIERPVFDANPWLADRLVVRPTEGWVDRPDGRRIQYWQLPPLGMEAGDTAPMILAIHGGPSAMWGPGEATMWLEWQLSASWGFGVVYCNPRGSGGYGEAFQRANHQDWGPGTASDCLAVVDAACTREWVDADRLVITGGSYGGYLTAWMIAHDDRFKAAVAQRGVYDLGTFYGEGNAFRLVDWAFGGRPFEPRFRELIERNNPFDDVADIKTPLLVLHGEQDLRTGVSQSAMMFRALRDLGRPVEYVLYPDAGHDLSRSGDPVQRMDRLDRILEFFTRFVTSKRATPPSTAVDGSGTDDSGAS